MGEKVPLTTISNDENSRNLDYLEHIFYIIGRIEGIFR